MAADAAEAEKYRDILHAAEKGNVAAVRGFVAQDAAAVKQKNRVGLTALHWAAVNGDFPELCRFLLERGADVEAANRAGQTPLHYAANNGRVETTKVLLTFGADIHAKDNGGDTPMDDAKKRGHNEVVKLLEEVQEEQKQKFEEELLSWQKSGYAPMPVVRLAFVGRGRAGKTTTLRRLKGEEKIEENELSTYGIEVWAGEVAEEMDGAFARCGNRLLDECAVKNVQRTQKPENRGAEAERREEPQEKTPDHLGGAEVVDHKEIQTKAAEDPRKEDGENPLGARRMDVDLMIHQKDGISSKQGISPRLQCFDFPGQKEYALLNTMYFHGSGIYLIFCDMSVELEEAWKDLKFWLWTVGYYATSSTKTEQPPIIVVGTKWNKRRFEAEKISQKIDEFLEQMPDVKPRMQRSTDSWITCLDNFGDDWKDQIKRLRQMLGNLALDLLTTKGSWREDKKEMPQHVGLQADLFPAPWIQAHELLTQLGEGVKLRLNKAVVKLKEGKGGRAELESELVGQHDELEHDVLAPAGCMVRIIAETPPAKDRQDQDWKFRAVQDHLDKNEGEVLSVLISCDFLHLEQVQTLLGKMKPQPIPPEDVTKVLQLMNELGAIFWLEDDRLKDTVALNVRKLSVALSALMSLRFWEESHFEHAADFREKLEKQTKEIPGDRLRFETSGVATKGLLDCLWKDDFDTSEQELMLEVMLRKGVMTRSAVVGEYIVPSCLPMTYLPEPPKDQDSKRESVVGYIDLDGFISANLLPTIADHLCKTQMQLNSPPQLFRNLIELRSESALIILSVVSVTKQRLLRVQVMTEDDKVSSKDKAEATAKTTAEAFWNALRFKHEECPKLEYWNTVQDLTSALKIENVKPSRRRESFLDVDLFIKLNPSLQPNIDSCPDSERAHVLRSLLDERFHKDLSDELHGFIKLFSLQPFSKPAGSFRFKSIKFPGDVDMEEYIIAPEGPRECALQFLSHEVQKLCETLLERKNTNDVVMHWGGLKAGRGTDGKTLTWTQEDIKKGFKDDVKWEDSEGKEKSRMDLSEALDLGHNTWTAKIDCFAKTTLFADQEPHEKKHFYEVTNVVRFGFATQVDTPSIHKVIEPVTKEKDFLTAVNSNIHKYGFEHPKAMKYVKRLWERSAFFSQRNVDFDRHRLMLEELKPILEHWVAKVSQIAAHAETLINMLKHNSMKKDAIEDLETLRENLKRLQKELPKDPEGEEGSRTIQQVLRCLECSEDASAEGVSSITRILEEVQDWLECCVEVVVINKLGGFSNPVSTALQERWTFPSDHPPIGATISKKCCGVKVDINMASWNVLNQHYMKYIENDKQGLKHSRIAEISDAERQDLIYMKVARMLMHSEKPKHVVCLQECWLPLVDWFRSNLPERFELLTTSEKGKKNVEAIIYDRDTLEHKEVYVDTYKSDPQKAILEVLFQLKESGKKIRVLTTHLPGNPYGPARRQFSDFVRCRQDLYKKVPTILLADMNFPDEAIRPLLKYRGQLDHVEFLPIPYPTNICQGSLLPKRIDCIASFSKEIEVKPLKANDVLEGLSDDVELLKSRSLELAGPQERVST